MEQRWRFYGREAEMAQLRAAFLAPGFDLIAVPGPPGRRQVVAPAGGRTELAARQAGLPVPREPLGKARRACWGI